MRNKLSSLFKKYNYPLLTCGLTFIVFSSLILMTKNISGFGQWYSSALFHVLPNTLGRIFSPLPFSVFEVCLYILCAVTLSFILFIIVNLFCSSGRNRLLRILPKTLVVILCFSCYLFVMVSLTCSMNYSRDGIAKDMGIVVAPASHEDLVKLCLILINDTKEILASESFVRTLSPSDLHTETKLAMASLGKSYPSLGGYYPNPKPIMLSSAMSNTNLTGIFSPYTIEANYNNAVVDYVKPYTICHELAHLKGYIREDDAGFIAYLACSDSNNAALRYSGSLNALSYTLNQLRRNSTMEEYQSMLAQVPKQALLDLLENQAYWQKYEGIVSKVSTSANHIYLKANSQEGGIQSYGRMVDLLLAHFGLNSNSV